MSAILGSLLALALALAPTVAAAGSGRPAIGLTSASGWSPAEPGWGGAAPAAVGCVGITGWWITGGHDYAGPRGEVLRTPDDLRWGGSADLCPTAGGAWIGAVGVGYGQQHGDAVYAAPTVTAGVAGFGKRGPGGAAYGALAPYLEPRFAIGVALPPGVSVEIGPYLMLAPSLVRAVHGPMPQGIFVGQAGLELSVLAGAASPRRPGRRD